MDRIAVIVMSTISAMAMPIIFRLIDSRIIMRSFFPPKSDELFEKNTFYTKVGDQICGVASTKEQLAGPYVRLWHIADIDLNAEHVCFRGQSDIAGMRRRNLSDFWWR